VLVLKVLGGEVFGGNEVVSAWGVGFCAQTSGPNRWRRCCRVQEGSLYSRRRSGVGAIVS
jgi:hypothetical protein